MKRYENHLLHILMTNNILNWQDLENQLCALEPHIAGKVFEAFCYYYYLTEPTIKDDFMQVHYMENTPDNLKSILNITSDNGIDLILKSHDNALTAIQCKFTSNIERTLTWGGDKLSHFIGYSEQADERVVFTNTYDVDKVTRSRDRVSVINNSFLQEIEKETFDHIKSLLQGNNILAHTKAQPWEFQIDAISTCATRFETENRGQLIMPCGTGKTLVGLKIKEAIKAKSTLVAVPSLWLLRQTKNYWAKEKNDDYKYLCVCSEYDIDNDAKLDNYSIHDYEVDHRVTTDIERLRNFLLTEPSTVIFTTFHSLHTISKAIKGADFQFDFIFCDEAHRTTGLDNKQAYGVIHDDNAIPSRKRLYSTATPRVLSSYLKKKNEDNDDVFLYDMNDKNIFGDEFFRMSFKTAIESKRLVDYQIIAVGINDSQIAKYLTTKNFGTEIADNYALEWVMDKYGATHAISFHSTIPKAEVFAKKHDEKFKETTKTFHINGTHTTSNRKRTLMAFKTANKSIISNVRCLSEGVDVPAIDAVYFCDPKSSKIDIAQSVGRALRLDPTKNKEFGYIVVPIYHQKHEEIETVVKKSIFNNLINVVRSMYDQDERLQDEIHTLLYGQKGSSGLSRTNFLGVQSGFERIILVGFEDKLKEALFDEIIAKTSRWDGWYYLLNEYAKENNGSTNPPTRTVYKGKGLGEWTTKQRYHFKDGKLSNRHIDLLNKIQFEWRSDNLRKEPIDGLKRDLESLEAYFNIHNHTLVPAREPKNEEARRGWSKNLARFVTQHVRTPEVWPTIEGNNEKRYNYKGQNIPVYKFLEIIQFKKEPKPKSAKRIIEWLINEREVNPNFGVEDFELLFKGNKKFFVLVRRVRDMYRKHIEGDEQVLNYFEEGDIETLNSLGFTWGYVLGEIERERFLELLSYRKSEGTFVVSSTNKRLYHWCKRRKAKSKDNLSLKKLIESEGLSQVWINELKGLGFNVN
jgi:superfamily II DNA or RNA helicase